MAVVHQLNLHDPFDKILAELHDLHAQKGADYGADDDALANVRAAAEFGLDPVVGVAIRMQDKMNRIQTFVRKGVLANESVEDAFRDLAVYAVIALQLLREAE